MNLDKHNLWHKWMNWYPLFTLVKVVPFLKRVSSNHFVFWQNIVYFLETSNGMWTLARLDQIQICQVYKSLLKIIFCLFLKGCALSHNFVFSQDISLKLVYVFPGKAESNIDWSFKWEWSEEPSWVQKQQFWFA